MAKPVTITAQKAVNSNNNRLLLISIAHFEWNEGTVPRSNKYFVYYS